MDKSKITGLKQAIKLAGNEKLKAHELLSNEMKRAAISSNELAEKISLNKENYDNISPRTIRYYMKGDRKIKNEKRFKAIAEALSTTHYVHYNELMPNEAFVNQDVDELPDDPEYWKETIEDIRRRLNELPTEYIELLCRSYKEILTIPKEAVEIAAWYNFLDKESQDRFMVYLRVLLNENSPSESSYEAVHQYSKIFEMLEKISLETSISERMDSFDLVELIKNMFPDKQNTYEAEQFHEYLYILLNKDLCKIAKNYLSLDSAVKKDMILQIADQMFITLEKSEE